MTTASPLVLIRQGAGAVAAHHSATGSGRLVVQAGRERVDAERFIRDVFFVAHGARLGTLMPDILGERDGDGGLLAACGLRGTGGGPLFLERYLDRPIEDAIAATGTRELDRADIVEIGNLAVRAPYTARHLITALTEFLLAGEAEWSVFTAVPALRNAFVRLGVPLLRLGIARIEALPEPDRAAWGRYYDKVPEVLAVRVRDAAYALLTRPQQ
jgi:hypothetical protein